jgi:hypothetical protein
MIYINIIYELEVEAMQVVAVELIPGVWSGLQFLEN